MKTVREVIRRAPIWVNPEHTTESAIVLMRGHNIGALPVLDGRRLVGMVHYSHLLGVDPNRQVADVMMVSIPTITPEMSVREAADVMARVSLGRLPVIEEGRLIGVVTDGDLLPELGRSFDPLTELAWSDSLREWAIERLKRGLEITVLFIDLDRFGQFNKLYGHIIGDEVLRKVAQTLLDVCDPDTDFLCKYGGDEFCIATLRPADEAADLAARIARRVSEIEIPTISGEHITCAIGQYGGKRTKEREHVHYDATLNSLINLASRDCMARKKPLPVLVPPAEAVVTSKGMERYPRLRLERIDVLWRGRKANVHVDLRLAQSSAGDAALQGTLVIEGLNRYSAAASAETDKEGALRLVAETTACALRQVLPEGCDVTVSDVIVNQTTTDQTLVTVVGQLITETQQLPIAGSAVVADDRYRASASAVLAAVNRPLGKILLQAGV